MENRFRGVDYPVELALPHRVGDFLANCGLYAHSAGLRQGQRIEVLSIHAAQGRVYGRILYEVGRPGDVAAQELAADAMTFRPGQVKPNRLNAQSTAQQQT